MTAEPAAVIHRLQVPLSRQQAFDLFVDGIDRWWPFRTHSCAGAPSSTVQFERRVGGSVTEVTAAGARHPWGTLTDWQPPRRFAMTWHPGQLPEHATRLAVEFEPVDGGCSVLLRHDGWAARGEAAQTARNDYDQGWVVVLSRFAEVSREQA
jgi:hypothetical protein